MKTYEEVVDVPTVGRVVAKYRIIELFAGGNKRLFAGAHREDWSDLSPDEVAVVRQHVG